jgi:hypothetical protein
VPAGLSQDRSNDLDSALTTNQHHDERFGHRAAACARPGLDHILGNDQSQLTIATIGIDHRDDRH